MPPPMNGKRREADRGESLDALFSRFVGPTLAVGAVVAFLTSVAYSVQLALAVASGDSIATIVQLAVIAAAAAFFGYGCLHWRRR